jgi:hypothetical protein
VDPLGLFPGETWLDQQRHEIASDADTQWSGIKSFADGVGGSPRACATNGAAYDAGNVGYWVAAGVGAVGGAVANAIGGDSEDPVVDSDGGAPESSFVPGDLYETSISSSAGNVGILAEVGVDGSQLTLSDVTIYGESGDLVNEVGPGQFLVLRNQIAQQAAAEGFDSLRITGVRVAGSSSSAPGKSIDVVINLSKYR